MQEKIRGYAPINGLNMYYEIHGEGSMPLVLIHGGGSTIDTSFGNILPLLKSFTKIIAVELQAHGRTSDRDAQESFAQDADDVAALLNHLQVDKANFLGYSNGATCALQIAIRHPRIVNKIIPIAGCCLREGFMPGFFDMLQNATLNNMPEKLRDEYLSLPGNTKEGLEKMFEKDRHRMVNFEDIPTELMEAIQAPALFMASDMDVMAPEHTVQMFRLVKGARLVILPGTHGELIGETGAMKHKPELVAITAQLVREFLAE